MTTDSPGQIFARAVDEATQQVVTTERSAAQVVNHLRDLTDQRRAHQGLAYALRDAETALDSIRRCRVLLTGVHGSDPRP